MYHHRLLLFFVLAVAESRTVRYSNVPPQAAVTTKMYELAVPGSAPIRIIEAEPVWSTEDVSSTTPVYRDGLEHRSSKVKNTTNSKADTIKSTTESTINNTYSPDALNNFLKEYSEKIKADRRKFNQDDSNESSESGEIKDNDGDKSDKSWGLVDVQYHKHPYEDQKGWVTLEAIPWSTSKISKWQSNFSSNNKYESKPWNSNNYLNKPQNNLNGHYHSSQENAYPTKNKYHSNKNHYNSDSSSLFSDNYSNKPDIRPSSNHFPSRPQDYHSKPMYGFDQKPLNVKPEFSDWQLEIPSRPSWSKPSSSSNNQWDKPVPDPWYYDKKPVAPSHSSYNSNKYGVNLNDDRGIITDGRPGNFPTPYSLTFNNFEPLNDRPENNIHPATHPANGNGEWILLSTTKGYQYPRTKNQRSMEVTPDSIGTRKGIRLTVLPPHNDTKVNMTTSHGGLLEVESTFESVEQSHKQFSERVKLTNKPSNKTKLVNKVNRRPVKNTIGTQIKPIGQKRPVSVITNKQDPTAVLAAVGAGMVPATMAMLVPFVAGRKRRSIPKKSFLSKRKYLRNNVKSIKI